MNKIIHYLRGARAELGKVAWPTRRQTRDHAIVVIAISIAVAIFLAAVDYLLEAFIIGPLLG